MTSVAVVGGGISGLAAAFRLRQLLGDTATITVVDSADTVGGKLRTAELAGCPFDVGAEAFLVRRPEAVRLVREVGLADRLRHPTGARASTRAAGHAVPMPTDTVMGVPARADSVAEVLSAASMRAVRAEPSLPLAMPDHDVCLGALLRARFGAQLVQRLVDPLLGGVYAGGADSLGLAATVPGLDAAIRTGAGSLSAAAGSLLPAAPSTDPVFGTLVGGLGVLTGALARVSGARFRTGVTVTSLSARAAGGWRLGLGAAAPGHAPADAVLHADAVLLAVPAPAARRLLDGVAPEAVTALAEVDLASMAIVGLALPPGTRLPDASGVLIGAGERRADGAAFTAKAFTFSSRKWAHLGGDEQPVVLRGSVGRFGAAHLLQASDDQLVHQVRDDLADTTGITAAPIDTVVARWGGALPQYGVGHLDRVARIEAAVADIPGLDIAGATLHGVGVPACIGTADAAARRLEAGLVERP